KSRDGVAFRPTYSTKIVLANHGSLYRVKSLLAKNSWQSLGTDSGASRDLQHPVERADNVFPDQVVDHYQCAVLPDNRGDNLGIGEGYLLKKGDTVSAKGNNADESGKQHTDRGDDQGQERAVKADRPAASRPHIQDVPQSEQVRRQRHGKYQRALDRNRHLKNQPSHDEYCQCRQQT